ncbi:uncharacterized protein LOC134680819 isoform X2 [Mytilus trossulus]|uniref:uncharacterized protein LOC134680819 isoform X2 n=1 Tax=Mytilus trossulus TaxID=6551 RepID=UPI003007D433
MASSRKIRKRPLPFYCDSSDGENTSSSGNIYTVGSSIDLPKDVVSWTVSNLGKLGIIYDRIAKPTPNDVLQIVTDKTGYYGYLTRGQQELKDLLFEHLDIDLTKDKLNRKQYYLKGEIINDLQLNADRIQNELEHGSNQSPSQSVIYKHALDFIKEVKRLVNKMADCNNLGHGPVPEAFYTSGQLYKTTIKIAGVKVTSVPDLVLEKNEDITSHSVSSTVTIAEVKKASINANKEERKEVDQDQKANIQHWLSDEVLGRHGGELLLAWNSMETGFVPGMIIIGTKIYFTLLHINYYHVHLLGPGVKNMNEVGKQKATVYYSEPKDILVKDDRNDLIQSMMRLNN